MKEIELDWHRLPMKSKRYTYQIRADGKIIKTSKKLLRESTVSAYMRRGKLTVKLAHKEYYVKRLVAYAFLPGYKNGMSVILKDGDPYNCRLENLFLISKHELGKITGGESRRKPVVVNGKEYYSVRACAKSLYCGYQTLSDYLNGKVKNSALSGVEARYV